MRDRIHRRLVSFLTDEQGASMAEYALLLAVVGLGTVAAVTALKDQIFILFQQDLITE